MNQQTNETIKDRFLLKEHLSGDPFGDVYRAVDLRQQEAGINDDQVAIKILKPEHSKNRELIQVLQEGTSQARKIQSPNVIAVYDFDRDGDTLYATMELVDGEPLNAYLERQSGQLPQAEVLAIIKGVCKGMTAAHKAGQLHSSFSLAKVFYTGDKIAKVFDFGFEAGAESSPYASCEQLTEKPATESDDVFSVAVFAYELLTGSHPYGGLSAMQAAEKSLQPAPVDTLTGAAWDMLKAALALDASQRNCSIQELGDSLASA